MGVIINGMEMPSRCEVCYFYINLLDRAMCNLTGKTILGKGNARLNHCPLEEVKEPSEQEKEIEELEKRLIELLTGKTTLEEAVKVKPRRVR